MTDKEYMKLALELAQKGCGYVNPNPMVGAVIVKDGRIIGQGYHERYGGLHAERNALADCKENPQGATIYVTLEPCCHYGKTPPCTEALIENGIAKVVIGSKDPNPLVAGKGIQILKQHGINVVEEVLSKECNELNKVFFHYIQTKSPYVVMKYAMTMDGKIATYSGKSKWITGEVARERVHQDRHRYSAIMIGVGTVLSDNPLLSCRLPNGRNPIRIICDTYLRTPIESQILATARKIPTILATTCMDEEQKKPYIECGCSIITTSLCEGHVDLKELMSLLGGLQIDSILLEGGGTLNYSALQSGIISMVQTYIAPKLFGGKASTPVMGLGVENPNDAYTLTNCHVTRLGEDFLIESEVMYHVHGDH
ncbi:MAG TPA: bifunctional diaminohydroxyphosphoribosylaminopyrimidine deaminase/5-amino-6-(5-phosphoribosylamino)uracil reductase RibD [Lachnospiraceae bacterium]|nr:bifunctional diaminohydroxyphosphoribosylaminopyrimidine deaminase/5-amino-6-(5-phosphoribosylamino)uracil reductase RibD [Lachnospiraceae bacterium]